MPTYIALTYTPEVDWHHEPEYAEGLAEYTAFEEAHAAYQQALALGMSDPHTERLRRRLAELPA